MRRIATILGLIAGVLASSSTDARAAPKKEKDGGGNFGVGGMIGNPIAFSGKWFIRGSAHALQFGTGYGWLWNFGIRHNARLHVDWVWHPGTFGSSEKVDVVPYVGVGIGTGLYHDPRHRGSHGCDDGLPDPPRHCRKGHLHGYLFGRGPIGGLALHFQDAPLDTFIELAWTPGVDFQHSDVDPLFLMFDFAVGARYYF